MDTDQTTGDPTSEVVASGTTVPNMSNLADLLHVMIEDHERRE